MSVVTTHQTIEVDGVSDVVVTDVADDGAGGYVREIRIFGAEGTSSPAVVTLHLKAGTADPLRITVPDSTEF